VSWEDDELADLRLHWGDAYLITRVYGMFRAKRRDDGAACVSPTAEGLRRMIRENYVARPVTRGPGVGSDPCLRVKKETPGRPEPAGRVNRGRCHRGRTG
jgi:hypothetical protein